MRFLICTLAVISASVFAQSPESGEVWVTGSGRTKQEAMDDGFRKAIEIVSGTVTLSEREIKKDTITKNEVFNYSAGYIKKYNILNIVENKSSTTIDMIVWVDSSKILNYKLNIGKTQENIDGNNLSAQFKSYINERSSATKLVDKVINDYPKRAFEITQGPYNISTDEYRDINIDVTMTVKWSRYYIASLKETLDIVSGNRQADVNIEIFTENPNSMFFDQSTYYITDYEMAENIVNRLYKNKMKINASIYNNNGKILQTTCVNVDDPPFVKKSKSNSYRIIYPKQIIWKLSIPINNNLQTKLSQIARLELSLENNCMQIN